MIKCRCLCMKSIYILFLFLFNFSSHVMSCPSSGDGDCVPSTKAYTKQSPNKVQKGKPNVNILSSNVNEDSDSGLPDDYIAKPSSYLKKINEKSKLNSKINKLNFELNDIIYRSSTHYDSNFNNEIKNTFNDINKLFIQNKKMDKDIFISLHKNIDELINSIVDTFDDEKSLKSKHYKYNNSDLFNQYKKYNEINDIIKTLEVMN